MMSVTSESSSRCSTISRVGFRLRAMRRPIDSSLSSRTPPGPAEQAEAPRRFRTDRQDGPTGFDKIGFLVPRLRQDPFPGHRVQIHHAAAVADRRVEILLGDLIELELRGDVFDKAFLPRSQEPECLV